MLCDTASRQDMPEGEESPDKNVEVGRLSSVKFDCRQVKQVRNEMLIVTVAAHKMQESPSPSSTACDLPIRFLFPTG